MLKKFIMENGDIITRVSRWIKIESAYNVTKKNSLWDYVTDENGYLSCQDNFNPENGTFLDYFKHNGRKYAINQFARLGGMLGGSPIYFEDNKKKICLCAYDQDNYWNPLFLELDDCGENVRLYRIEYKRGI